MQQLDTRSQLVRTAMRAPYLGREEERALALRWKNHRDHRALHRIATAHMRLVVSMAGRFRRFGLPIGDLVQEGHIGLLEAAARFEPARQVRFSTYASWWIRAAMQDYVLRNWSIVRGGTSTAQKALFFNLRRLRSRLQSHGGSEAPDRIHDEIARMLGVSSADVALMDARLSGSDTSLDAPVRQDGERGTERLDHLVSPAPAPDEVAGARIDGERRTLWLRQALATLDWRELTILRRRRLSEEGATLEALGRALGISKERVRQIESRALEKLRAALIERHPDIAA